MKKFIFLLLACASLLTNAQETPTVTDSISLGNIEFKSPFPNYVAPSEIYKEYVSDSLQLSISFTDSLIVMETAYQGKSLMNLGIKNMVRDTIKTTLGIMNTQETNSALNAITQDIMALAMNNDAPVKDIDFGKEMIDKQEACWLKLNTKTEDNKTFTSLIYYVTHPKNHKLYMIYLSTYAPEFYDEELSNYYNFLKTLKWYRTE